MAKDHSADGLRGLAAVSVMLSHSILAFFPASLVAYFPFVAEPDAVNGRLEMILATPGLSALWNGRFAVLVFFVLSGYVLTKQIVELRDPSIARSLAARRYFRLAVPVLASALLAFGLMSAGLYRSYDVASLTSSSWLKSMWAVSPDIFSALREGIYGAIFRGESGYNPVFWTMRIEFIGSLLILAYRSLTLTRRGVLFGFPVYVLLIAAWNPADSIYYFAFLLGTHINDAPVIKSRRWLYLLAVVGIYLGGVHDRSLYAWLGFLPGEAYVREGVIAIIGAALLVYSVRSGAFSVLLKAPLTQSLGRVSYSLYLVHLPVLLSVGCGTYLWLVAGHGLGRIAAAAIAIFVYVLVTLAVALAFTRLVDEPGIRLSKRLFPGGGDWSPGAPTSPKLM